MFDGVSTHTVNSGSPPSLLFEGAFGGLKMKQFYVKIHKNEKLTDCCCLHRQPQLDLALSL